MDYSLDVISRSPDAQGKTLRKYKIEGIETVGALHDEPFEVRFTNHTWNKVQVKITLDGIDIMSGELATMEPTVEMWIVQPNSTLSIKAFPETDRGGSAFVFSHAGNSVAAHTNNDLSHRGIIAAAVFTEGAPEPLRLAPIVITNPIVPHWNNYWWGKGDFPAPSWTYYVNTNAGGYVGGGTQTLLGSASISGDVSGSYSCSASNLIPQLTPTVQDQQSLPAVAAGQYTEQEINHAAGLNKPLLDKTLQVRYLWWNELETKLSNQVVVSKHPSGFPADTKKRINLGNAPKVGTPDVSVPTAQPFLRIVP